MKQPRRQDVFLAASTAAAGPRQAGILRPGGKTDRDDEDRHRQLVALRRRKGCSHEAIEQKRHEDAGDRQLHVRHAHDQGCAEAPAVAAPQAEPGAEGRGENDRGATDRKRGPAAVEDGREDVAPLIVGAERMAQATGGHPAWRRERVLRDRSRQDRALSLGTIQGAASAAATAKARTKAATAASAEPARAPAEAGSTPGRHGSERRPREGGRPPQPRVQGETDEIDDEADGDEEKSHEDEIGGQHRQVGQHRRPGSAKGPGPAIERRFP